MSSFSKKTNNQKGINLNDNSQIKIERLVQNFYNKSSLIDPNHNLLDKIYRNKDFILTKPSQSIFFGRKSELSTLKKLILFENKKTILLSGLGGIGKTSIAARFVDLSKDEFDHVIWQNMRDSEPFQDIVSSIIKFLSKEDVSAAIPSLSFQEKLKYLVHTFKEKRCLLVLDNLESALTSSSKGIHFNSGFENFGIFLDLLCNTSHSSCLIVTSRQIPSSFKNMIKASSEAAEIKVKGLKFLDFIRVAESRLENVDREATNILFTKYSGNPQILMLALNEISDLFLGDMKSFCCRDYYINKDIEALLLSQLKRLSDLEKKILFLLTISREFLSGFDVISDFINPPSTQEVLSSLSSLLNCSLIERNPSGFTLQNVILEYLTNYIVVTVAKEIKSGKPLLLRALPLLKASSRNHIREAQERLIITPILEKVEINGRVSEILNEIRKGDRRDDSYLAGNLLNLKIYKASGLSEDDFSELFIRQAYLKKKKIYKTNFRNSHFVDVEISETLGIVFDISIENSRHLIVAGDSSGTVYVWDSLTRVSLGSYREHKGWVRAVACSESLNFIVSGSADSQIKLWSIDSHRCFHTFRNHSASVNSLDISSSGKFLVSGGDDEYIYIFDLDELCLSKSMRLDGAITRVKFSPCEKFVVIAYGNGRLCIFFIEKNKIISLIQGKNKSIRAIGISHRAKFLASACVDNTIRVWSVREEMIEDVAHFRGHMGTIRDLKFDREEKLVVSCSDDQTIRFWSLESKSQSLLLEGHTNRVRAISFDKSENYLISCSTDASIRWWNLGNYKCDFSLEGHKNWIWSVDSSRDAGTIVVGSEDSCVHVWRKYKHHEILIGHTGWVRSASLDSTGSLLLSGSDDQTVKLWDLKTKECLHTFRGHTERVRLVLFSNENTVFASCGEDSTIYIWDAITYHKLKTLKCNAGWIRSLSFSRDDKYIAGANGDATVSIWHVDSGDLLTVLKQHELDVRAVSFSPKYNHILSAGKDGQLLIWDLEDTSYVYHFPKVSKSIWAAKYSICGQLIASAHSDNIIRVWNSESKKLEHTFEGHTDRIKSLSFSRENSLVSAGEDGSVRVWDLENGNCNKVLRTSRLYEGSNFSGVSGLSQAQLLNLKNLGGFVDQ